MSNPSQTTVTVGWCFTHRRTIQYAGDCAYGSTEKIQHGDCDQSMVAIVRIEDPIGETEVTFHSFHPDLLHDLKAGLTDEATA